MSDRPDRRRRARWQMTTRSRFAAVIGLASLGVVAVQLTLLTGEPSPVQLLVLVFWTLVGGAYLASAWGQRLRERVRPRHRRVTSVSPASPVAEVTGQTGPIALG